MKVKIYCGTNLGVSSCFEVGSFNVSTIVEAHNIAFNRFRKKGFAIDKCVLSYYRQNKNTIYTFLNDDNSTLVEYLIEIIENN